MIPLFLMGVGFAEIFVVLFLITGLALGIFFLSKYLLTKIFKHFSKRRIVLLSILAVWIVIPLLFIGLMWVLVRYDPVTLNPEVYYESLDETYLHALRKGMTKRDVVELIGENDTTSNVMIYDLSLPGANGKYELTVEFENNQVVNYSKNGSRE
jgi:hypothetical protein